MSRITDAMPAHWSMPTNETRLRWRALNMCKPSLTLTPPCDEVMITHGWLTCDLQATLNISSVGVRKMNASTPLLHEHAAQIVEFLLCALGLMHHGHRNEHTMSAGSRLNGRQCAHRAVETLATGDHANRARAVRRQ
jgi:hypothetical protein